MLLLKWDIPKITPRYGEYHVFEVGHPDALARAFRLMDDLNDIWGAGTHWIEDSGIAMQRKSGATASDSTLKREMLDHIRDQRIERAKRDYSADNCSSVLGEFTVGQLDTLRRFISSFSPYGDDLVKFS